MRKMGMLVLMALVLGTVAGTLAWAEEEGEAVLQEVESTLIKKIGYDEATQVLTVIFVTSDEVYEYFDVPAEVYAELMAAESKGKFFSDVIKDKYRFEKKP